MAKKKILLFGGAFDPIHNGHMISALIAREKIGIDQVTLIPCGEAPHKNRKMSKKHRLEMCKKVFYIDASFTVDSYEIRKSSPSYTIETVDFVSRLKKYGVLSPISIGLLVWMLFAFFIHGTK